MDLDLMSTRCLRRHNLTLASLFFVYPQAFNYISNKGYARMSREDEKHWVDLMNVIHDSVKGGMKYNTGTLLMVLSRPFNKETAEKEGKEAAATK